MWGIFFRKFLFFFLIAIYFNNTHTTKEFKKNASFFRKNNGQKKCIVPLWSAQIRDRAPIEKKRSLVGRYLKENTPPVYHCNVSPQIALIFGHILNIADGCASDGKPIQTSSAITTLKHRHVKITIEEISFYAYKQSLLKKFLVKNPFKE